jgi:hypothetical protein
MLMNKNHPADEILSSLNQARDEFHVLLGSMPEDAWKKKSLNSGWTNGEILAHITFGFIIINILLPMAKMWGKFPRQTSKPFALFLDLITRPFNWINALGARGQGKVFTHKRIAKIFDKAHLLLLSKVRSISDSEWQTGMYYPTKWDANFSEFMTLEKLLYYPVVHFKFHKGQIAF